MHGQCKHLKLEDFAKFTERGLEDLYWLPVESHLAQCPDYMRVLEQTLICEATSKQGPEKPICHVRIRG